jgi:rubredoxin
MKRLNFTLDDETVTLLEELAEKYYGGNKSQTVRAALESLAAHTGHEGWVIAGYTPKELDDEINCHSCGESHEKGEILYRPVFERGKSPGALPKIPSENWLDCPDCAEKQIHN